ncbi:hypothetical protein PUNSTDRAFT_53386 [Punctularia strigosozonata HHB-11173 SS5]|uniref:uncharacterized protein n=1 Tax=Punctularia strigosozonata (strain HHB-11173) TaxID=741275 RepID=UPI0004417359|nr:uncharacterized protein PUNSTDRAFT_53386 [Punctularia strigosozonata HHB-11173 SS5]EIN06940.1 hypothetical protein PUNSTDRAFT_53386 [Punctularia strigosozonata HHB-11173 SS5]
MSISESDLLNKVAYAPGNILRWRLVAQLNAVQELQICAVRVLDEHAEKIEKTMKKELHNLQTRLAKVISETREINLALSGVTAYYPALKSELSDCKVQSVALLTDIRTASLTAKISSPRFTRSSSEPADIGVEMRLSTEPSAKAGRVELPTHVVPTLEQIPLVLFQLPFPRCIVTDKARLKAAREAYVKWVSDTLLSETEREDAERTDEWVPTDLSPDELADALYRLNVGGSQLSVAGGKPNPATPPPPP